MTCKTTYIFLNVNVLLPLSIFDFINQLQGKTDPPSDQYFVFKRFGLLCSNINLQKWIQDFAKWVVVAATSAAMVAACPVPRLLPTLGQAVHATGEASEDLSPKEDKKFLLSLPLYAQRHVPFPHCPLPSPYSLPCLLLQVFTLSQGQEVFLSHFS